MLAVQLYSRTLHLTSAKANGEAGQNQGAVRRARESRVKSCRGNKLLERKFKEIEVTCILNGWEKKIKWFGIIKMLEPQLIQNVIGSAEVSYTAHHVFGPSFPHSQFKFLLM